MFNWFHTYSYTKAFTYVNKHEQRNDWIIKLKWRLKTWRYYWKNDAWHVSIPMRQCISDTPGLWKMFLRSKAKIEYHMNAGVRICLRSHMCKTRINLYIYLYTQSLVTGACVESKIWLLDLEILQGRTHSYYPYYPRYFPCQNVDRTQIAYWFA